MSQYSDRSAALMGPDLPGYGQFNFNFGGYSHSVYHSGAAANPSLLLMPEIAGFSPGLLKFSTRLIDAGFRVYIPWLYGPFNERAPARNAVRLCISKEFGYLRAGHTAPVADWLRALTKRISALADGRNVGAIGMCLTGALVIPLIIDPAVKAAVAAQPAVPCSLMFAALGLGPTARASELNVHASDIARARTRLSSGEAHLLAVRSRADRICPAEKLERLRAEFPFGMTVREYATEQDRNRLGDRPHALFTKEHRLAPDAPPGNWAHDAFADLVEFFNAHLRSPSPATRD